MERILNKKYRMTTTDENFDDYLKAIGMNFITRKLAKSFSSVSYVSQLSEDEYTFTTSIPIVTHVQRFKLGEEIVQDTMDGRKVKNIFLLEGNTLIEEQIEANRKVIIAREYSDTEMIGIVKVNEITTKTKNAILE